MPKVQTSRRVVVRNATLIPSEAQVKAAIKRGDAAATEMESSLTELRDLSDQLNIARNETTDRLARLLSLPSGSPPNAGLGRRV